MDAIFWNLKPRFCIALQDHPRFVYAKHHWDLSNNEGAIYGKKIRAHTLDPAVVAPRQLQTYQKHWSHILDPPPNTVAAASNYQTHIGPTLHVGPIKAIIKNYERGHR